MSLIVRQVTEAVRAGTPLLFCETAEDERFEEVARRAAQATGAALFRWSVTRGLERQTDEGVESVGRLETLDTLIEHMLIREPFTATDGQAVMVIGLDVVGPEPLDPRTHRLLKDLFNAWEPLRERPRRRSFVFSGVGWAPPPSLAGYVVTTRLPLPSREEITQSLDGRAVLRERGIAAVEIANRAVGLSNLAIEYVVRRIACLPAPADPMRMLDEIKREEIQKTQLLDIVNVPDVLELGGFAGLKAWFQRRRSFFSHRNDRATLVPRGVLLLGFPGCGKSHAARWIAKQLGVPLVAMDIGRVQDRWVGSSEARMRIALSTLEAAAPVVLFIDEIEKSIAGFGEESSGVTTRLVGHLLTWLADHRVPVFVVATCNRPKLPPELTRAGRFDASFVVLPPSLEERAEILRYVAEELRVELPDDTLAAAVEVSGPSAAGFTGAELRQLLVEAAYEAGVSRTRLTPDDIRAARRRVAPLVESGQGRELKALYDALIADRGYLAAAEASPPGGGSE